MTPRERIEAELDRREVGVQKALALTVRPWRAASQLVVVGTDESDTGLVANSLSPRLAEHIALHDPADALRRYAADRERLEDHRSCQDDEDDDPCGAHSSTYECCACHSPGPCTEQYRVAQSLGIDLGEQT